MWSLMLSRPRLRRTRASTLKFLLFPAIPRPFVVAIHNSMQPRFWFWNVSPCGAGEECVTNSPIFPIKANIACPGTTRQRDLPSMGHRGTGALDLGIIVEPRSDKAVAKAFTGINGDVDGVDSGEGQLWRQGPRGDDQTSSPVMDPRASWGRVAPRESLSAIPPLHSASATTKRSASGKASAMLPFKAVFRGDAHDERESSSFSTRRIRDLRDFHSCSKCINYGNPPTCGRIPIVSSCKFP